MQERLKALQELIESPTTNLAALGTGIAIVVVVVVVVALVLIAIALPGRAPRQSAASTGDAAETAGAATRRRAPRWLGWLTAAGIISAGVLGAIAVWYETTSTNDYCARTCHAMASAAKSHANSAHHDVTCVRCHEGRHWQSFPQGVGSRTYSLYLQVTGARPRPGAFPPGRCLECHSAVMGEELIARNGEPFRHRVIGAERECRRCHGVQGHVPPRVQ